MKDIGNIFSKPAIPGVPNSTIGDPFGLGAYFGFNELFGDIREKSTFVPYIIIGVGTVALIFVLKK
jgi:hypothetical protein